MPLRHNQYLLSLLLLGAFATLAREHLSVHLTVRTSNLNKCMFPLSREPLQCIQKDLINFPYTLDWFCMGNFSQDDKVSSKKFLIYYSRYADTVCINTKLCKPQRRYKILAKALNWDPGKSEVTVPCLPWSYWMLALQDVSVSQVSHLLNGDGVLAGNLDVAEGTFWNASRHSNR